MTPFDPRLPVIASVARVKTCHVYHCWQAWKQMGVHFNATMFAAFAGLEEKHVAAILGALETHGAVPKGRTASPKGTRLSPSFKPPQDWLDFAIDERQWTPKDAADEAANFCDFWWSKPGADASKLDWKATWRKWVRNSRRPDGDYRPSRGPMVSHPAHMERTAALYERMGRTDEAAEIRAQLAKQVNVLPFRSDRAKVAISGG